MNKRINQAGLALLKKFEGFSNISYVCPAGKCTIGYGHVILSGEEFTDIITKEYAEKLLKKDVGIAERCVNENVYRDLTDNQFSALCCFVYNIGCKAFEGSTLCDMLNRHRDIEDCAKQFLRWNKAGGKVLSGLTKRREAERDLFLSN